MRREGVGRGGRVILMESDIREAMKYTNSNAAAARYLKIAHDTYKKNAKLFIDSETGKTLWELHKNQRGKGCPNYANRGSRITTGNPGKGRGKASIERILNNEFPNYPLHALKHRLWRAGLKERKCACCGMEERRITDGEQPLLLAFKTDEPDYNLDKLEVLCYNCYFLTVGNIWGRKSTKVTENSINKLTAPDAMRVKDMIENVKVDEDGNCTNIEDLGTAKSALISPLEVTMDNEYLEKHSFSKEEIEELLRADESE